MSNMDKILDPTSPMDQTWGVAEAKNRFSELITRALTEGPQRVRRRDEEVVVISAAAFAALEDQQAEDFKRHLLAFPGFGDEAVTQEVLRRDSYGRNIDL